LTAYLVHRCHGLETRLLPEDVILELSSYGDLKDFVNALAATEYSAEISDAKNAFDVERGLSEVFIKRLLKLLEISSGEVRDFLKAYFRRFEVENIARILRKKRLGRSVDDIVWELLPVERLGFIDVRSLVKVGDFDEALKLLEGTPYDKARFKGENLLLLEASLRNLYYKMVLKEMTKIPEEDRKDVARLIGMEIDLFNCHVSSLSLLYGYEPAFVGELIIDNPLGASKERFLNLIRGGRFEDFFAEFPKYKQFLEAIMRGEGWRADVEAFRIVKRFTNALKIKNFTKFFYVMKYITDCEIEYRNLRAIVISIHHNLPMEARKDLLILLGFTGS